MMLRNFDSSMVQYFPSIKFYDVYSFFVYFIFFSYTFNYFFTIIFL